MKFEYIAESGNEYLSIISSDKNELDTVTLGMLENNNIEGLLPLYVMRNNDVIECRYDLEGLYSFNEVANNNVAKERLTQLLNAILDVCNTCGDYLIDCSQLVLDPEYIYTDERGSLYRFVVSPIAESSSEYFEKLKSFILDLSYSYNEDCTYLERLKDQLRHCDSLSVDVLKNVLKESGLYREKKEKSDREQMPEMHKNVAVRQEKIQTKIQADEIYDELDDEYEDEDIEEEDEEVKSRGLFGFGKKAKGTSTSSKKGVAKTSHFGNIAIPGEEDGGYSKGSIEIPDGNINIKSQKLNIDQYKTEKVDFGDTQYGKGVRNKRSIKTIEDEYYILRTSTNELFDLDKDEIRIGRKKSLVDICLSGDLYVSRLHATLYNVNGRLYIENNGSENNGTYVNGKMITKKLELQRGDIITIGDEKLIVK